MRESNLWVTGGQGGAGSVIGAHLLMIVQKRQCPRHAGKRLGAPMGVAPTHLESPFNPVPQLRLTLLLAAPLCCGFQNLHSRGAVFRNNAAQLHHNTAGDQVIRENPNHNTAPIPGTCVLNSGTHTVTCT